MTFYPNSLFLMVFSALCLSACSGSEDIVHEASGATPAATGKIVEALDDRIWELFQDSQGHYWFGSNGKGVYRYTADTLVRFTTEDGLVHDQIRGIQEDGQGNLYFETHGGISKYDGRKFTTLRPTAAADDAWQLQPGDLWFGYNANDLFRYDGKTLFELKLPRQNLKAAFGPRALAGNFDPYDVFGVHQDGTGHLWFGTGTAGVFRYDGSSFLWFAERELSVLPDGRVPGIRSIIQDKHGYYWLSNLYYKYKINPDLPAGYEKFKAATLPPAFANDELLYYNSALADREGNLWMATYGSGLWKYDGNALTNVVVKNAEAEALLLMCVFQDRDGTIWLGTDNDGVYRQFGEGFEKFEVDQ